MEKDWVERLEELAAHLSWIRPHGGDASLLHCMIALCVKAKVRCTGDFNRFMEEKK